MGHGDGSTRRSHSAATKSVNERPPMNTDPCSSVLLTCKSLSGGQGYFHREDAKNAKKAISKTSRSSRLRGGFLCLWLGCSVFIGGFILCSLRRRKFLCEKRPLIEVRGPWYCKAKRLGCVPFRRSKMSLTRRDFLLSSALLPFSVTAGETRYRVGITTNTRGGWEDDVFLSFREARGAGFRYVESFVHYFTGYFDRPEELRKKIDEIGVRFVTI